MDLLQPDEKSVIINHIMSIYYPKERQLLQEIRHVKNYIPPITDPHSYSPALSKDQEDKVDEIKAFRKKITTMTLKQLQDEFGKEVDTYKKKMIDAKEKSYPWNSDSAITVDFEYWSKMEYWSIQESIALVLGRNPEIVTFKLINKIYAQKSDFIKKYMKIHELARRSEHTKKLGSLNTSSDFLEWAKNRNIEIPEELSDLVVKRTGALVDYKELCEVLAKDNKGLRKKNNELQSTLSDSIDEDTNKHLHTKEKATWGKIVKILLSELKIEAESYHKAATTIRHIAELKGLPTLSENTIVSRLKELPED